MNLRHAGLRLAAFTTIACISSGVPAADPALTQTYTLSWFAPTTNVDGTPLTDLQGYYIYVGDSPDRMIPLYYKVALSRNTMMTVSAAAVRYYAVSAVNVNGVESALTGVVRSQ